MSAEIYQRNSGAVTIYYAICLQIALKFSSAIFIWPFEGGWFLVASAIAATALTRNLRPRSLLTASLPYFYNTRLCLRRKCIWKIVCKMLAILFRLRCVKINSLGRCQSHRKSSCGEDRGPYPRQLGLAEKEESQGWNPNISLSWWWKSMRRLSALLSLCVATQPDSVTPSLKTGNWHYANFVVTSGTREIIRIYHPFFSFVWI